MNLKTLTLLAVLAVPGLAQERWQIGFGINTPDSSSAGYLNGTDQMLRFERKASASTTLMAGWRAWDFAGSDLSITGEHQFRNTSDLEITNIGGLAPNLPPGKSIRAFRSEVWAPGVQWNFHHVIDWGLGLQYRFTRLTSDNVKTNHDRFWLNAYIGHTFKTRGRIKPYVALRNAVALSTTRRPDLLALNTEAGQKRLARSMDSSLESSLQFGVRF